MTTTERVRHMTVTGDARAAVGQIRGPDARGVLLIVDGAVYGCPECGAASDWTPQQHLPGCSLPAYRTRLSLRVPTDDEVQAAAAREAADDMPAQPWDLPVALAGSLGYVDVACDNCGTLTRQHGISRPSKAWALCPTCQATPQGQARLAEKQRQMREEAAQVASEQIEAARPAQEATTPVTMRILGRADGEPSGYEGQWVVEYDATRMHLVTTKDREQAARWPSNAAAFEAWKGESGLPWPRNAPLTAFTVAFTPEDDEELLP